MEYNQDTGLASVPESGGGGVGKGTNGGGAAYIYPLALRKWWWWGWRLAMGLRGVGGGVRAFSSTVTYGPFSRDYIQLPDLARKRRLGSPNVA